MATTKHSASKRDRDHDDDFPYKNLIPQMKDDIARRYLALREYRPAFRILAYSITNAPDFAGQHLRFCFGGARDPLLMVLSPSDYDKYNLISDFFIEQHRIRAYRGDDPDRESVYDYWQHHREEIQQRVSKMRSQGRDRAKGTGSEGHISEKHEMREYIYANKMEVGTFRPTVAAGIVWLLRSRLSTRCEWVLDPCAGWGDRLLGFMASDVRGVVDVDPNTALGAEYPKIRDWVKSIDPSATNFQHHYIPAPFEDIPRDDLVRKLLQMRTPTVDIADEDVRAFPREDGYDLVLIAPPYFDLEVYVPNDTAGTQSISRYPTFEEWFNKFLIANLKKCGEQLRVGGILALIINQAPTARTDESARFLHRMISDVTRPTGTPSCVKLRYLGVISYAEVTNDTKKTSRDGASKEHIRSPQPIWFWMRERT